jgi:hypothetical protein
MTVIKDTRRPFYIRYTCFYVFTISKRNDMDVHEHEKQSNFAKYKEIRFYCCSTFHNNSRVYIGYDH